ncbi:MAG: hypothetical protein APR62_00275 [Smithella sp. SDB]|nr:MAG: hypothetical protein APR62_00275 [Smithella sp. SDB]
MNQTSIESKGWNDSEEDNKKLVRTIFGKMGGNKSKLFVKKIDYTIEVKHQDFEESVLIPRKNFDDKNVQAIEKCLSCLLK